MLSQEAIVFVNLHHQKMAMRKIQMVDLQSQYAFIRKQVEAGMQEVLSNAQFINCLLYTSPSPRDLSTSRMPSSA